MDFILVGIGGAIGALCRYGVTLLSNLLFFPEKFPWTTLFVNVFGSFLLGILFYFSSEQIIERKISPEAKLFLATGFLGSFTTFSTYTLDSFQLFKQEPIYFWSYFLLSNTLSLLALTSGYFLLKNHG